MLSQTPGLQVLREAGDPGRRALAPRCGLRDQPLPRGAPPPQGRPRRGGAGHQVARLEQRGEEHGPRLHRSPGHRLREELPARDGGRSGACTLPVRQDRRKHLRPRLQVAPDCDRGIRGRLDNDVLGIGRRLRAGRGGRQRFQASHPTHVQALAGDKRLHVVTCATCTAFLTCRTVCWGRDLCACVQPLSTSSVERRRSAALTSRMPVHFLPSATLASHM
mmetsp:Transcript_39003/g.78699  ORF Transcript_39003/g.78699 Transcript_39003/m.78699 type:complete len:220 (+) Transcript_39003:473-1132(+)